jgi:hypothetical protein
MVDPKILSDPEVNQNSFFIDEENSGYNPFDSFSFKDAFRAARHMQGPGTTFVWKGKKYTTDTEQDVALRARSQAQQESVQRSSSSMAPALAPASRKDFGDWDYRQGNLMNGTSEQIARVSNAQDYPDDMRERQGFLGAGEGFSNAMVTGATIGGGVLALRSALSRSLPLFSKYIGSTALPEAAVREFTPEANKAVDAILRTARTPGNGGIQFQNSVKTAMQTHEPPTDYSLLINLFR